MNIELLIIIQTGLVIISFVALFVMLFRDLRMQQRQLEHVIYSCAIANIGMLIELNSDGSLDMMKAGRGIQIIGVCSFMISLIALASYVSRVKVPFWFTSAIFVIDCVVVASYFFDAGNDLYYFQVDVRNYNGYLYMHGSPGPGGMIFWVIGVIVPYVACFAIACSSLLQDANKARKKDFLWQVSMYLLVFVFVAAHWLGGAMPFYNPSFFILTLIFSYLVFSRWRYQNVDVVAAAAQTAIDSIDAGVITLNEYREILYYNEAAKNIIPGVEYLSGLSIDRLYLELPDIEPGEQKRIQLKGRTYQVSVTAIVCDEKKNDIHGYAILINDMTETYDLIEKIKAAQKKADEASQVKTRFLANISHEIRTPMNAIMGLAELIIEESRGRKVYDMAVTIKNAATSLLDLVNNVLDVSKLESGKMQLQENSYNLDMLIKDVADVMRIPATQKGLFFKVHLDDTMPCVLNGDEGKIRQCLINLINNAIKFTEQGSVSLEVSGIRRGDKVALTFMVIDTGIGIEPENKTKIFGEFEQVDKIVNKGREGSGLGLAITRQLVELLGGVIDAESTYGRGSTFTIRLSQKIVNDVAISQINQLVDDIVEEPRMFEAPDIHVLLVDDNKVNLMVAKGFLDSYKMQIDTAVSGEEAVKMASALDYHIILMDHMMPGIDGVEAVRRIRKYYEAKDYHPYIAALTANAYGGIEKMFLANGFDDFISKPIEKEKMHQLLLKAIDDHDRHFTDQVLTAENFTEDQLAELFMEGVDVRAALSLHRCSPEEYMNLVEVFYMEGLEKRAQMKEYFENKDWKNYSILVHGLKSSAANLGATMLCEQAKAHEYASKDIENVAEDFITEDFEALDMAYKDILEEAGRLLDKHKARQVEVVDKRLPALEIKDLLAKVKEIFCLSENFKSKEAAEQVEGLLQHKLDEDTEKILNTVRMKYKLYDDDAAEELLHELIMQLVQKAVEEE